tara:strand:+ start:1540 stop:2247 length:708 start_codon:yes stop_codon:yes gene_type:complete
MAFKMKGPSMYPNYKSNGAGAKGNIPNQQKSGYEGMPDGRATSSPFQMNEDKKPKSNVKPKSRPMGMKVKKKTIEDYIKEGFTPSDARQMMKDGATTGKTSPNKFLGGALKGIGGALKKGLGGALKGKDGKFGIGDVGRLAMGPLGAAAGATGLFMKDSPAKAVKKPKVTSKMVKNPDGSYTETKSDGKRTASSTYKKSKRPGAKNVYKNEHGQTRQISSKSPAKNYKEGYYKKK